MSRAVKEDPSYYWGWMQLADWHAEEGDKKDYLEAARHLVRLAPQNEVAMGYLGDAKLKNGDRAGAKSDFRRAVELEPDYSFGTLTLFDLHLEDGELDAAGSLLASAKKHIGGPYVVAREVQLLAKRGKTPEALASLRSLCALATEDRWPLDAAMKALGSTVPAQQALLEAALASPVNPLVGSLWTRSMTDAGRWKECRDGVDRLKDRIWAEAASEYVRALATARRISELDGFVSGARDRLRADVLTWGAVGNALESIGRPAACIEWMSDWRTRSGVRPWMLSALVVSFRTRKASDEALEAGRGALGLAPDHSYPLHRLWVAFEQAVRGDAASGRAALEEVSPESLNSYYQCLRWLLLAVVERSAGRLRSASAALPSMGQETALLLAYRQALHHIVNSQGGFRGLWTRLRYWR
jgi:tetratricopeptide (TPR) repeat protein